jgi:hypothetical protein
LLDTVTRERHNGTSLFLSRWLRNPLQMGSIVPSSPALCGRIARHTRWENDEVVVELGAGAGLPALHLLRHLAAALPEARPLGQTRGLDAAEHPAGQRLAVHAALNVTAGNVTPRPPLPPRSSCG